eukprot:613280-Pelagomonas_calceolata.AAC.1
MAQNLVRPFIAVPKWTITMRLYHLCSCVACLGRVAHSIAVQGALYAAPQWLYRLHSGFWEQHLLCAASSSTQSKHNLIY